MALLVVFGCLLRGKMGGTDSQPCTPLQCMLKNFKKGFSGDYGIKCSPQIPQSLCEVEWPKLVVDWPPTGSYDPLLVNTVWKNGIAPKPHGHPDQFPYIDQWLNLVLNPPNWLQNGMLTCPQTLLMIRTKALVRKPAEVPKQSPPVLIPDPEDTLLPPPYPSAPLSPPPPSLSSQHSPFPPPAAPSTLSPSSEEASPADSFSSGTMEGSPPLRRRLWSRAQGPAPLLSLRQVAQYPSLEQPGHPFLVYAPLSTADLYNWKTQNPPFSDKPQALTSLIESILHTHLPTWDDCQQLLLTLFTSEERVRIQSEARKALLATLPGTAEENRDRLEVALPTVRPDWDPNSGVGFQVLTTYHRHLLAGIRGAARKPINLSRVTKVVQGPEESPGVFLERLLEAYLTYTPFDPSAPENARALNLAFVSQSAPDIRKKLQKLDGFAGMNTSQLLEIAQKVYNNRDVEKQKQITINADKTAKRQVQVMVAAFREAGLGSRPLKDAPLPRMDKKPRSNNCTMKKEWQALDKNQCASCKRIGHWKNECPERAKKVLTIPMGNETQDSD